MTIFASSRWCFAQSLHLAGLLGRFLFLLFQERASENSVFLFASLLSKKEIPRLQGFKSRTLHYTKSGTTS